MDVVLVLKSKYSFGDRILVELQTQAEIDQVEMFLQKFQLKEAFEFIKQTAEVKQYLPLNANLNSVPSLVLFEDLLP